MKYSISFLAKALEQLPPLGKHQNEAVEAVLFDRSDLETETWQLSWKNIEEAAKVYDSEHVTFHFPVNDSDYTEDSYVLNRLIEGLQRATDLGLHGIVVHSNRVRRIKDWRSKNLDIERRKVLDKLVDVRNRIRGDTWIGLENMPVMDNRGIEIDPTFVFPSDFQILKETEIGIVWDICHYTNSIASIQVVNRGLQDLRDYPNRQVCGYFDFELLKDKIVHWHFSAFRGIANPKTGSTCEEGVLPEESTLGKELYQQIFHRMKDHYVVFEVKEENYQDRKKIDEMFKFTQYPL